MENRLVVARGERVEQWAKWGESLAQSREGEEVQRRRRGGEKHLTAVPSYPWGAHPKTPNGCLKPHTEP